MHWHPDFLQISENGAEVHWPVCPGQHLCSAMQLQTSDVVPLVCFQICPEVEKGRRIYSHLNVGTMIWREHNAM